MKAIIKTHSEMLSIEVEAPDLKGLFAQISDAQDAFDAATKCGACGSPYIRFRHRVVDKFDFYSMNCSACGAELKFGQRMEGGGLFAKRKDEDMKPLPNGGWAKYEPQPKGK